MPVLHAEIAKYVNYMMLECVWIRKEDWGNSLKEKLNRSYVVLKLIIMCGQLVIHGFGLYNDKNYGLTSGTLMLTMSSLMALVTDSCYVFKHEAHEKLISLLDRQFQSNSETWMVSIRNKYTTSVWNLSKYFRMYTVVFLHMYVTIPFIIDQILHFGFDYLNKPFVVAAEASYYLGTDRGWNARYYAVVVMTAWNTNSMLKAITIFIFTYLLLCGYAASELEIFKEALIRETITEPGRVSTLKLRKLAYWHADIIELNRALNDFVGLPCAFSCFIISIILTACLFIVYMANSDVPIMIGSLYLLMIASFYCNVGQGLENKSVEVFNQLYDIPWYEWSPDIRKNLIMMMRQARSPIVINYHGIWKMQLESLTTILSSTYSGFTLIRSTFTRD